MTNDPNNGTVVKSANWRLRIYQAAVALSLLLVARGFVSQDEAPLWLDILAPLLLGAAPAGLAASNVNR